MFICSKHKHVFGYCQQNFHLFPLLCLSSTLPPAPTLFLAELSPLRIHLRQLVYSLLAVSAFLSPILIIPPFPCAATVLQCVCEACLRCHSSVAQRSGISNAASPRHSLFFQSISASLHLRNWESLPPGCRGNNEVQAESAEQRPTEAWG